MIFKVHKEAKGMEEFASSWNPKELKIEKYIFFGTGKKQPILESSVFGEPLLLVEREAPTRQKKRADILALDRAGNCVIIELKRDTGMLGVETQALQYLAEFSAYKGLDFIRRFSKHNEAFEEQVRGFLGDDVNAEDLNSQSRIVLVARGFDPALFSMGEWLSSSGVPFRCIEYTPFEVGTKRFLSFSIAFDRSPRPLYPLLFHSKTRAPKYFWHNIANSQERWWRFLREAGQISTGFGNVPGGQGERILRSYIAGDTIFAYATGFGAIGWGVIERPSSYRLLPKGHDEDLLHGTQLHRLDVAWKASATRLDMAIPADVIRREYGIYHPVSTSVSIDPDKARNLIRAIDQRFREA